MVSATLVYGPPIHPGYGWRLRVEVDEAVFLDGQEFVSHVRKTVGAAEILATLSTADGTLVRVSDTAIEAVIAGDVSQDWRHKSVVLDIARIEPEPIEYIGFRLEIPLDLTVTRGLDDDA